MNNVSTFVDFLLGSGFTFSKENKELGVVIYENNGFFVRITKEIDRKHFIDLSRAENEGWKGWTDMDVVRFFVIKQHYRKDGPDGFEELSQFFVRHYEEIRQSFNETNFPQTEAILNALKKERGKVLFGYEEPQQDELPPWLEKILETFK